MLNKVVYVDIETKDPYLSRGLGSGWVFRLHNYPDNDYKIIGVAINDKYYTNIKSACSIVQGYVDNGYTIVCHNALYDLGGLMSYGVDFKDCYVLDTRICAILFDNTLKCGYSLDELAKKYLKLTKLEDGIIRAAWDKEIYPMLKKEQMDKRKAGLEYTREGLENKYNKVKRWTKENLDIMQEECPEVVEQYAVMDTRLCKRLLEFFVKNRDKDYLRLCYKYSWVNHVLIDYRKRGVRIDLERCRNALKEVLPVIESEYISLYRMCGEEFNIRSVVDLPRILDKFNISYPRTPKGNPSITKTFLKESGHKVCRLINKIRVYENISKNFIQKILDMQKYICHNDRYGRIHPELMLFGASATGRFSASNPNIQQIPKRDPVFGPICRGLIVAEEGEEFYSLDFSSQEIRLQVHYAVVNKCNMGKEIADMYKVDPNTDMHQVVADMANISRTNAKTINLGLSYGMGGGKLCTTLGLPTNKWTPPNSNYEVEVAGPEGKEFIKRYHKACPYLKSLTAIYTERVKVAGYIETIGGRRLKRDKALTNGKLLYFDYKGFNKLIQGGSADQTIECMIKAHREKLPVLFTVHDEMNMSGTKEQALKLKEIMETSIILEVPSVTDIQKGHSWAGGKYDNNKIKEL